MAYIGATPTAVPLTGADIEDGTIQIADLSATGTKDATTFLRGDGTFAEAGGTNTPAFSATTSTSQRSLTSNTAVKVDYDTVDFNIGVTYDTSNKRFTVPSGGAGKYFFSATARLEDNGDNNTFSKMGIFIYKNGSTALQYLLETSTSEFQGFNNRINVNGILDLAVSDYVEVYALVHNTAWDVETEATNKFQGFKLIGV